MTEREAKNKPNKGNLADMEMDQRREWSFGKEGEWNEGGREEKRGSGMREGGMKRSIPRNTQETFKQSKFENIYSKYVCFESIVQSIQ